MQFLPCLIIFIKLHIYCWTSVFTFRNKTSASLRHTKPALSRTLFGSTAHAKSAECLLSLAMLLYMN